MQTIGNSLQLIGAVVTGGGLFYAWNRASHRFDAWRKSLQTRLKELRSSVTSRGSHEGSANLAVTVELTAAGVVTRTGTVEERLRWVEAEANDLRDRLTTSLSSIPADIDRAIAAELGRVESLSNAIAVKDIYCALAGIVVGAIGTAVQLFA